MADIKITGYHHKGLTNDRSHWMIDFQLSEAPNQEWKSRFDDTKFKHRMVTVSRAEISDKELMVKAPGKLNVKEVVGEMSKLVATTNSHQDASASR